MLIGLSGVQFGLKSNEWWQNQTTAKRKSYLFIIGGIPIGQNEAFVGSLSELLSAAPWRQHISYWCERLTLTSQQVEINEEKQVRFTMNTKRSQHYLHNILTFKSSAGKVFYRTAVLFSHPAVSSASTPFPSWQIFLPPIDSSYGQNFRNAVILRHLLARGCNFHEGHWQMIIESLIHVD